MTMTMTGRTILVVDDEPDARDLLAEGLNRRGFATFMASDGEEALRMVTPAINVVVTDLVMPHRDGVWLLEELARLHHSCLRVVLTSFADRERAIAALNAGADYLVEKPFTAGGMADLLDRLLSEKVEAQGLGRILGAQLAGLGLTGLGLGERERELVTLVLKGLPNKHIAEVQGTSEQVVKNQLHRLYAKLGITSRGELFHLVFPI